MLLGGGPGEKVGWSLGTRSLGQERQREVGEKDGHRGRCEGRAYGGQKEGRIGQQGGEERRRQLCGTTLKYIDNCTGHGVPVGV